MGPGAGPGEGPEGGGGSRGGWVQGWVPMADPRGRGRSPGQIPRRRSQGDELQEQIHEWMLGIQGRIQGPQRPELLEVLMTTSSGYSTNIFRHISSIFWLFQLETPFAPPPGVAPEKTPPSFTVRERCREHWTICRPHTGNTGRLLRPFPCVFRPVCSPPSPQQAARLRYLSSEDPTGADPGP